MKGQSDAAPPKVIIVSPWYGGSEGGVAVVTESLVQSLVKESIDCAVIVMVSDGLRPIYATGQSGERVVSLCLRDAGGTSNLRSKAAAWLREFIAKRAFLRLIPRDGRRCVVHLHYSMPEYSFFSKICSRLEIPMVITFHGGDLTYNMEDARTRVVTRAIVNQCKVITAVSDAHRQTTLDHFPGIESQLVVVHNAVPPDFATAVGENISSARDIDALYVGNLVERKGVDVLLRAWAQVIRRFGSARLLIAGDGEDADELRKLARELRVDHAVTFLGRQPREALPGLYQRAKVLVVPSRTEPLGVVVLEGLLSGAAVIASDTGGIPEIITNDKHGLLVPVDDVANLAAGIVRMLSDDVARARLAAAGRQRVLQLFSSTGIAKQYREVYERAMSA